MAHAEKCPICHGTGKDNNLNTWGDIPAKSCHGCGGKGWVEVRDDYGFYYYPSCTCHLKGKSTADIPCPIHD